MGENNEIIQKQSEIFGHITIMIILTVKILKRIDRPKNENYVINYSPTCRSKPVRPSFIFNISMLFML